MFGPPNDSNIPRKKQHGKCPRTFTNSLNQVFYVYKCLWAIKSTGWFAGATEVHPKAIPQTPSKFCAVQGSNTTFKTSTEKAIQWSNGFEIGAALGIKGVNLKATFNSSAQTGYDSNALVQFHFKNAGFACGTDADAPQAAVVVMRSSKS
jgi:hypothetical protein